MPTEKNALPKVETIDHKNPPKPASSCKSKATLPVVETIDHLNPPKPATTAAAKPAVPAPVKASLILLLVWLSLWPAMATTVAVTNNLGAPICVALYTNAPALTLGGLVSVPTNAPASIIASGGNWTGLILINSNNNFAAEAAFTSLNGTNFNLSYIAGIARPVFYNPHTVIIGVVTNTPGINTNPPVALPIAGSVWGGTNNPNGFYTAGYGSTYVQFDTTGTNVIAQWVKYSATGNTNWTTLATGGGIATTNGYPWQTGTTLSASFNNVAATAFRAFDSSWSLSDGGLILGQSQDAYFYASIFGYTSQFGIPQQTWTIDTNGNFIGASFTGDGGGLTDVPGTSITGQIPFTALPSGVVTNNAHGLSLAGTFTGNGSSLSNLNAAALTGQIPQSAIPLIVVTNNATGLTLSGTFTGNGANLTNLNAAILTGQLPVATLPPLVLTNNATNVTLSGTFTGNGGSLSNVPATTLTGQIPPSAVPPGVLTNNYSGPATFATNSLYVQLNPAQNVQLWIGTNSYGVGNPILIVTNGYVSFGAIGNYMNAGTFGAINTTGLFTSGQVIAGQFLSSANSSGFSLLPDTHGGIRLGSGTFGSFTPTNNFTASGALISSNGVISLPLASGPAWNAVISSNVIINWTSNSVGNTAVPQSYHRYFDVNQTPHDTPY